MKNCFRSAVSALAVAFAPTAYAQQPAETADTTDASSDAGSGDIVVTANRESSLLSKTPIALTAVSGDMLRAAGVGNPTELAEVTPNLAINRDSSPASGGGLQITIRGVTSTDATEKGDPSAAFLRDGIYIARQQAQEVSFFDIERVEVLRGPQGTLYGRNTTAGVVHLLSVRPKDYFEISGDFGYSSFDSIEATGVVNIPVADGLALRAAVNHDQRDSIVNPTVSTIDIDPYRKNTSVRLSALAEITDNLKWFVQGDYSWIKGSGFAVVPVTNFFQGPFTPDTTPVRVSSSIDAKRSTNRIIPWEEYRDNLDRGVMSELNWNLGFANLTWLASYRAFDRDEHRHSGPGANLRTSFEGSYWQHSEELRLALGGDSWWKAQLGGYYFKEKSDIALIVAEASRGFFQNPTVAIGKALFAQGTITPTDGLNLTGGVRYSHDEKSRKGFIASDPNGTKTVIGINDAARNFSKVTWRVGADYDVADLGLVYASVSTGYKAGGFNDGCIIGTAIGCDKTEDQLYYSPETLTAYEAGFKWRFDGDAFRLNGAIFHYDYSNLQLSQSGLCAGVQCQITTNAAKAKIDGVELEALIRPANGHLFNLTANWLDARYDEFNPTAGVSFAGLPLSRAPKWSWTAGYTFTQELNDGGELTANIRTRFSDRYDLTDLATRVHFYQPSFTKTDISIGYTAPDARWNVQLFAKNLENTIALTFARNSAGSEAAFEDPRSIGVRLGFKI